MDESRILRDRQIEKLARELLNLLFDRDEIIELIVLPGEHETTVRAVTASEQTVVKLGGQTGRTVQSIRTILAAAGTKLGHRYRFEVVTE